MWWKRKPEVNPFTPKVPETAEEMSRVADQQCERITRMFYGDLLEQILKQSNGGNKSYSVPDKYFDEVTISYKTGERLHPPTVVRPMLDFKLLNTLLTDKGYNVLTAEGGRISSIFWMKPKK
jgi:hypothetical protein